MIYFALPYRVYEYVLADKELRRKVFAHGYPQRSNTWNVFFDPWEKASDLAKAQRVLEELKEVFRVHPPRHRRK